MAESAFAELRALSASLGDEQPSLEAAQGSVVLEDSVPSTAAYADLTAFALASHRCATELSALTRAVRTHLLHAMLSLSLFPSSLSALSRCLGRAHCAGSRGRAEGLSLSQCQRCAALSH